jgi:hypothetical protein
MSFTKGPWQANGNKVLAISDLGTYVPVVETHPHEFIDGTGVHKIEADQAIANANLIAAGPEMIEALRAVYDEITAMGNAAPSALINIQFMILRVISKATHGGA